MFFVIRAPDRVFFHQLSTTHWSSHPMPFTTSPSFPVASQGLRSGWSPLRCQAAFSAPGFLHCHVILLYFPSCISHYLGEAQHILKATSSVCLLFFLKPLLCWEAYHKCDISVSQVLPPEVRPMK